MRILALQANSDPGAVLQLDKEIRDIKRTLASTIAWGVEVLQEGAVQAPDLQTLLLRYRPDVLHFSGHGNSVGELMFETAVALVGEVFRVRIAMMGTCGLRHGQSGSLRPRRSIVRASM